MLHSGGGVNTSVLVPCVVQREACTDKGRHTWITGKERDEAALPWSCGKARRAKVVDTETPSM